MQRQRSGRPVLLLGASMGGMVAYEAAATAGASGLIATCLLDPREVAARRAAARWPWLGAIAPTTLNSWLRWPTGCGYRSAGW